MIFPTMESRFANDHDASILGHHSDSRTADTDNIGQPANFERI